MDQRIPNEFQKFPISRFVAIYDLVYARWAIFGWEQGLLYGEWLCIGGLGSPEVFHERAPALSSGGIHLGLDFDFTFCVNFFSRLI